MAENRWESTDAFVAACKAFDALDEAHSEMGNHDKMLTPSLEDINTIQDLLIEQGYAIQKLKS